MKSLKKHISIGKKGQKRRKERRKDRNFPRKKETIKETHFERKERPRENKRTKYIFKEKTNEIINEEKESEKGETLF